MTLKTERFTLRITKELKCQLEKKGKQMGVSLNALVAQILWDWAKQNLLDSDTHQATNQ